MELVNEKYIAEWIAKGETHLDISTKLQRLLPGVRGLSERSVRRYCDSKGFVYRSRLSQTAVNAVVASVVRQVNAQILGLIDIR